MVTKFCSLVSCLNGTLPIKSHEYLITKSCKITWKIKTVLSPLSQCFMLPPSSLWGYTTYQILYISACTRPMATKNGKVVTHSERLLPINSYNHLNMFLQEVTWQIKNIISPLSQWLWLQDLWGWWHTTRISRQ